MRGARVPQSTPFVNHIARVAVRIIDVVRQLKATPGSPIEAADGASHAVPRGQPLLNFQGPLLKYYTVVCYTLHLEVELLPSYHFLVMGLTSRPKGRRMWIARSSCRARRTWMSVAATAPAEAYSPSAGAVPHAGLVMTIGRRLEPEDIAMLELTPAAPIQVTKIKKLRDSHHALARALATGMSNIEAGRITGFDNGYISILKSDPAFQELLAFYEKHDSVQQADLRERMTLIALDVSQEIRDRLHNEPETFGINELRQLLTNLADRVGYGPSSTVHATVDVTENLSYSDQKALADALREIERRAAEQVIEHRSEEKVSATAELKVEDLAELAP
jgi:hypothetical protein